MFSEAVRQQQARKPQLEAEAKRLQRDRQHKQQAIQHLAYALGSAKGALPSVAGKPEELETTVADIDQRLSAIRDELAALSGNTINKDDITAALGQFTPIWEVIHPSERIRLVQLLVERVEYDARQDAIQIAFRASGMKGLVQDQATV